MSDANHQEKLTHISQVLLQLSQGSNQDKVFRKKASGKRLLKKLWGDGNNDAWWEQEKDTSVVCIFNDEQIENLKALKSFVNYRQNRLGPKGEGMPQVDTLKVTAGDYEDFVCDFDGQLRRG
jgi:hypothetical protein